MSEPVPVDPESLLERIATLEKALRALLNVVRAQALPDVLKAVEQALEPLPPKNFDRFHTEITQTVVKSYAMRNLAPQSDAARITIANHITDAVVAYIFSEPGRLLMMQAYAEQLRDRDQGLYGPNEHHPIGKPAACAVCNEEWPCAVQRKANATLVQQPDDSSAPKVDTAGWNPTLVDQLVDRGIIVRPPDGPARTSKDLA